jgi:hypothetical protein
MSISVPTWRNVPIPGIVQIRNCLLRYFIFLHYVRSLSVQVASFCHNLLACNISAIIVCLTESIPVLVVFDIEPHSITPLLVPKHLGCHCALRLSRVIKDIYFHYSPPPFGYESIVSARKHIHNIMRDILVIYHRL